MSAGSKAAAALLSENQGEIISLHYSPGGKVSSPFALKMALVRSARRARGLTAPPPNSAALSPVTKSWNEHFQGKLAAILNCFASARTCLGRGRRPRLRNLPSVASPLSLSLFPSPSHLSGPIQGFRFIGCRAALLIQALRLGGFQVDGSIGMACGE